jgi:secretion/DNA translocation related TadE-like protein
VLAAAMLIVLVVISLGGVAVGSAVIARHRAQAAADLGALAAAGRIALGGDAACASAASIARRMGATIASCAVDGLDVVVSAEVAAELGRWGVGTARAAARAGPVDDQASPRAP